jgi:hypothetical protein
MQMNNKLLYSLLCLILFSVMSCKSGCMECSGISAPREYCADDYIEKGDFEAEISEYELQGGVCEDK